MELRPHQTKALHELDNGKILRGGVGSGKTPTAVAYYLRKEAPRDIYVLTTAKKRDSLDWEKEFAAFGIGKDTDATIAGVLTVDSWNNIANYRGVRDAFFIFDEQRVVGSGAWTKSFVKIARANHWILLSATPGDTWLDYIPVFLANGFYKNRTEFLREHVIFSYYTKFPKVERYVGAGRLVRHRNNILVEMPFERHTRRIINNVKVKHDPELLEKVTEKRWNVYKEEPLRDIAEMFGVARRVVNTDPTRLSSVRMLMAKHPRLIVFYNFNYELDQLRTLATTSPSSTGIPSTISSRMGDGGSTSAASSKTGDRLRGISATTSAVQIAEWNGHKHEEIPKTDRWVYLVQYIAGSEGWNCIETDAICFYSLTYSYKNWEQAFGRIDRMNTPFTDLHYYVLQSEAWIDKAIAKSLKTKKNFNEAGYAKKTGLKTAA